jgi:cytidine deaminase
MDRLLELARTARKHAYAPYSGYRVGAAILDDRGQVHTGCNVENLSYGATICAERAAVLQMVSSGGLKIDTLALVTEDGATPCGICLQVLSEFSLPQGATRILIADESTLLKTLTLLDLLPHAFRSEKVLRT